MGPTRMVLSKPVIAAISGYAVAGGLELALWCDLRVVEEDAVMGVFCRRWGVPLIDGGTVRLPRLIGHSRAMDMILTGRGVDATEALAMGLANLKTNPTPLVWVETDSSDAYLPDVNLEFNRWTALPVRDAAADAVMTADITGNLDRTSDKDASAAGPTRPNWSSLVSSTPP